MKPTVIGSSSNDNNEKKTVKPTVIPTQVSPQTSNPMQPTQVVSVAPPTLSKFKPTVMPAGNQEVLVTATNHVEVTPRPVSGLHKPTTIFGGVERKRIVVTIEDLRKLNPGIRQSMFEKAIELIHITNVDDATDRTTILWASDLQRKYGELIGQALELSQSPLLSKVNGYISRMMEILGLIDLKKICGFEKSQDSFWHTFTKEAKRIDTLAKLTEAQVELGQLMARMRVKLEELLDLKEKLETLSAKIDEVAVEVEVAALAASFLSDYVRTEKQNTTLAQRFSDRSMSLTQTLAQIRSGDSTRDAQVEQPLTLISSVQHVANVMMPGWLGSVVELKTILDQKRTPTVTEVNDLGDQMAGIIETLKGRK